MKLLIKLSIAMMLLFSSSITQIPIENGNTYNSEQILNTSEYQESEQEKTNVEDSSDSVFEGLMENDNYGGTIILEDGSIAQIIYMSPETNEDESLASQAVSSAEKYLSQEVASIDNNYLLAATSTTNPTAGLKIVWDHDPGYGYGSAVITTIIDGVTYYLYCIEPYMLVPTGQSYSIGRYEIQGILSIINYGFPSNQTDLKEKYNKSDQQAYVATFIAINAYLGNYNRTTVESAGDGYVNALLSEADNGYSKVNITVSKNNVTSIYNSSKNRLESNEYISININRDTTRTFTLSGLSSGVYVIDENGNKVTSLKYGQKFKLATDNLNYSGSISFSIKHDFDEMAVYKFETSSNVQPLVGSAGKDPSPTFEFSQTFTAAVGSFELTKLDSKGNAVQGAVFMINGTNYTTNSSGKITVNDITPGSLSYVEVSVPNPLIVDTTQKTTVITAGNQTSVIVTNQIGKGIIEITKNAEDGQKIANAIFEIKNPSGDVVDKIATNTQGIARSKELDLGSYTITEISVPEYYILDNSPKTVTINYKDSSTPVVTASVIFTNLYQPIAAVGVDKIRINTQKASEGLDIEVWYSKVQYYEWSLNNFRNAEIVVDVIDKTANKTVVTKTYTAENFPSADIYTIPASYLTVDSKSNYEVKIVIKESNKITLSDNSSINTDGYTSSEENILQLAQDGISVHVEEIIRTERSYGQTMQVWKETFDIEVPKTSRLRAGRGYAYDVQAAYNNELDGENKNFTITLNPDLNLVDGDWYENDGITASIPLTLMEDGYYKTPRVYAEKSIDGTAISEETYNALSEADKTNYRDGGYQILTPLWSTDIGVYALSMETSKIGINEFTVTITDEIDIYAYMYGWMDKNGSSPTIKDDGVIVSPVVTNDKDGNGMPDMWDDGSIPDNWGIELEDGSKVLTLAEKQFFGLLGDMVVSYDLNGGSGSIGGKEVIEGQIIKVTSTVPQRIGYDFAGWLSSADGKIYQSGDDIQILEDTKLIAQWNQRVYTVAFNLNGGSGTITSQSVAYGAKVAVPSNPARAGYTFVGWSPDITQTITDNKTFTAQWTPYTHSVTFNLNGGSGTFGSLTKTYGSQLILPTSSPTRTGYSFAGWKDSNTGQLWSTGANYTPDYNGGTVTLTAQWSINTFAVTYNANGGSGAPGSQTKTYGTNLTLSGTQPTRTGYSFLGWNTNSSGTGTNYSAGGTYSSNAAVTLYARWSINTFAVSYNANGGSGAPGSQTKTYGTNLTLSGTQPTRTGYTFSGWNTNSSGTGTNYSAGGTYSSNAAVTLYAKWTAIPVIRTSKSSTGTFSGNSNYTATIKYTLQYQGNVLQKVDYEIIVYKKSGSGYYNLNKTSSWSLIVAGQSKSGTMNYDFRNGAQTGTWTISSGSYTINSSSFTNSLSFKITLDGLGSVTLGGSSWLNP